MTGKEIFDSLDGISSDDLWAIRTKTNFLLEERRAKAKIKELETIDARNLMTAKIMRGNLEVNRKSYNQKLKYHEWKE